MSVAGIIFSNVHDDNIRELTRARTIASVPFGCRYRFIDFTLSNMVNSDIHNISVITNNNYLSLMDHIGSGKDWDLARRSGGIKMLPPNVATFAYHSDSKSLSRLEALKGVVHSISKIKDEYVVLSDCDVICNIDLNDIIEYHAAEKADITLAVKKMVLTKETAKSNVILSSDEEGNVTLIRATADLETGGKNPADGRKIKGTIHWLSAETAVNAEVRLYDKLFTLENVADMPEGKTYGDYLNLESVEILTNAKLEPSMADEPVDARFQFVRTGYFIKDSKHEGVYNRIVGLKDSFPKT